MALKGDRLSALPGELRLHILSFLPSKDAIATSILSSAWRYDWLNLTNLVFNRSFFLKKCDENYNIQPQKKIELMSLFLDFLDHVFTYRKSCILPTSSQDLTLYLVVVPELRHRIIYFLDRLNVKNLLLGLSFGDKEIQREAELLCSVHIQVLTKLHLCDGYLGCNPLRLPSRLTVLTLDRVRLNDMLLEKTLDSCSAIECLNLIKCTGFVILKLSRLPKLKDLYVEHFKDLGFIETNAPHIQLLESVALEILELNSYYLVDNNMNSMGQLVNLRIEACGNIDALRLEKCKNLTTLELDSCNITDDWFKGCLLKLPNLEYLSVVHCDLLENIDISLKHLQTLELLGCIKLDRIYMDCPNLCKFTFMNMDDLIFLSSTAILPPTTVDLWLPYQRKNNTEHVKLHRLLKSLRRCKTLTLRAYYIEDMMILWKMRHSSYPPLFEVKHLKLLLIEKSESQPLAKYVEDLLWLCPQLESMQVKCSTLSSTISFQFKHINPSPRDGVINCDCYGSQPIPCWRHSVQNFVMQEKEGFEGDDSLEKFFQRTII